MHGREPAGQVALAGHGEARAAVRAVEADQLARQAALLHDAGAGHGELEQQHPDEPRDREQQDEVSGLHASEDGR